MLNRTLIPFTPITNANAHANLSSVNALSRVCGVSEPDSEFGLDHVSLHMIRLVPI